MTPETLQTISQITAFVGVVLAGLGTFGAWWYDSKVQEHQDTQRQHYETVTSSKLDSLLQGNEDLRNQLKPFELIAKERFPGLSADEALSRLSSEVRELEGRTENLELEMRQISGEVSFVVQGDWSAPLVPGGSRPLGLKREQAFITLVSDDPSRFPVINMSALDVSRENLDPATARVWLRARTPDGQWPLGQSSMILEHYRTIEVVLPMISRAESSTGELTAVQTAINLSLNGSTFFRRQETLPIRIVLPDSGWRKVTIEYEKPLLQIPPPRSAS